jgi:hypothetical protein
MFPLVEAYLARAGTKKAFCGEQAVPESVLTYWVARYNRSRAGEAGSFVEITPSVSSDVRAVMEVVFPHGVRLRLFSQIAPAYLEQLVMLGRAAA